jgi:biopolymer transport protein ExbB/TolQ
MGVFSILALAIVLQCFVLLGKVRWLMRAPGPDGREIMTDALDVVEKRLALLGTIANASPFVGLLGTVIGIIRAFHSIASAKAGGISVVAGGISEALVSTAAGLAVAIPASMMYNYFTYHMEKLIKRNDLTGF